MIGSDTQNVPKGDRKASSQLKEKHPVFIIIATKNRPKDLRETLESIAKQTVQPEDVIIIDDSKEDIFDEIKTYKEVFSKLNIHTIRGGGVGSAHARNIGIDYVLEKYMPREDAIILFMDDDVELEEHALEILIGDFERFPDVMGVTGFDENEKISALTAAIKAVFGNMICQEEPRPMLKAILSKSEYVRVKNQRGFFMSFRAKPFIEGVRFDNQMIKYSLGEDYLLSVTIAKKYKTYFLLDRKIRLKHRESRTYRMANTAKAIMLFTYLPYIRKKIWGNLAIPFIPEIIRLVRNIIDAVLKRDIQTLRDSGRGFRVYLYCWKHIWAENIKCVNEYINRLQN